MLYYPMLVAVLGRHARLPLSTSDIFVTIAGGIRIDEPAADLAVVGTRKLNVLDIGMVLPEASATNTKELLGNRVRAS